MDSRNQKHAQADGRRPPSRLAWFLIGATAGVAVSGLAGLVIILVAAAWVATPPPPVHADVSRTASLVARRLLPPEFVSTGVREAELHAALAAKIQDAAAMATERSALAPVAAEYGAALLRIKEVLDNSPSGGPLIQAGLEAWQGRVNDDSGAFLSGLLGMGGEVVRLHQVSQQLETAHARVVACRLRVADAAMRLAVPPGAGPVVELDFQERGVDDGVTRDALVLRNVSGRPLTGVVVISVLVGETGDEVRNCFFADRWEADGVLVGVCNSAAPFRETVHHVKQVQCMVVAVECSSGVVQLAR